MTDPDSWFQRMERRKSEDRRLLAEWARANGDRDLRHAREFVEHVRRDIGVKGVITAVEVKPGKGGPEVVLAYYLEPDLADALPNPSSEATPPPVPVATQSSAGGDQVRSPGESVIPRLSTVSAPVTGSSPLEDTRAAVAQDVRAISLRVPE
ncbi:hypothetical protein [Amycolatopsis sp. cmx-11-12]|uniref:hypothetical protein n=1 Tax=Amycolatopsis sp. cmx-11-12 TaxID=2785795 RepID=UPI0039170164